LNAGGTYLLSPQARRSGVYTSRVRAVTVIVLMLFLTLQSAVADTYARCCDEPCDMQAQCTVTCAACPGNSTMPAKAANEAGPAVQAIGAADASLHAPPLLADIWRPPRSGSPNSANPDFFRRKT